MANDISLAWAIPVDFAQLAARVAAYVETKAAITTLIACIPRSNVPAMSKLPSEVVIMIADALKDASYLEETEHLIIASKCVQKQCQVHNHFTKEELFDNLAIYSHPNSNAKERERKFLAMGYRRHDEAVDDLLAMLRGEERKFTRCKEIFINDFGIHPCFIAMELYTDPLSTSFDGAEVAAYLAFPITNTPIPSKLGSRHGAYTLQQAVDPATISQGISDNRQSLFTKAIQALRLKAPHTQVTVEIVDLDDELFVDKLAETIGVVETGHGKLDSSECRVTRGDNVIERKPGTKYRTHCIDCGTGTCKATLLAKEPVLMMLGSGEVQAW